MAFERPGWDIAITHSSDMMNWSSENDITSDGYEHADANPDIYENHNGSLIVTWQKGTYDGEIPFNIWLTESPDGINWNTSTQVTNHSGIDSLLAITQDLIG